MRSPYAAQATLELLASINPSALAALLLTCSHIRNNNGKQEKNSDNSAVCCAQFCLRARGHRQS